MRHHHTVRAGLAIAAATAALAAVVPAAHAADQPVTNLRLQGISKSVLHFGVGATDATACTLSSKFGSVNATAGGTMGFFGELTDLPAGTNIDVTAFCDTPSGPSAVASTTARTMADTISQPQNLATQVLGPTSAQLTWDPPANTGGPDVGPIEYRVSIDGFQDLLTKETSFKSLGLKAGTQYNVSVTAHLESGGAESAKATASFVTQDATAPISAPQNFTATIGATPTSVDLDWGSVGDTGVDDGGSPITGYRVFTNGANPKDFGPYDYDTTISGLKKGTKYTFSVAAVNSVGVGPAATVVITTTDDTPIPPAPKPAPNPGPAPVDGGTSAGASTSAIVTSGVAVGVNSDGSGNFDANPATVGQTVKAAWPKAALVAGKPFVIASKSKLVTNADQQAKVTIDGKTSGVAKATVSVSKSGVVTVKVTLKKGLAPSVAKKQAVRVLISAPAVPGFEALAAEHTFAVR